MTRALAEHVYVTPRGDGYELRCARCGAVERIAGRALNMAYHLAVWRFEAAHQQCRPAAEGRRSPLPSERNAGAGVVNG